MTKLRRTLFLFAFVLLSGCANPLNRATSDGYLEECSLAERRGRLAVAEEACSRALTNVDWGNLGPELKSQRLYNLARIKRQLGKFSESEALLKQSIALEEGSLGMDSLKVARRLVELSVSLAGQEKWAEGAEYLVRVIPVANGFSGQERAFTKTAYVEYGKKLRALGLADRAGQFEVAARAL
jgi:tetratricopeptide (TPR) repeat protein